MNATVCDGGVNTLSQGVFQCTLKEEFRVEVQAGDILGLELPPTDDQDFEVFFTSGGPVNYVFQGQILSAAELANRDSEVEEQPQINVTILSPSGMTKSLKFYSICVDVTTIISACESTTTTIPSAYESTTTSSFTTSNNIESMVSRAARSVSVLAAVGGAIAGFVVLAILITVMIVIFTMWKRNKKWTITATNGVARTNEYPMTNPIYKGKKDEQFSN